MAVSGDIIVTGAIIIETAGDVVVGNGIGTMNGNGDGDGDGNGNGTIMIN